MLGNIDAVYDRAALIALPVHLRNQYVKRLTELLQFGSIDTKKQIYLIALEYQSKTPDRPPFSVNTETVAELYQPEFSIQKVSAEVDPAYFPHDRMEDKTQAIESAYLLTLIPT